jgi:hypothetical protein
MECLIPPPAHQGPIITLFITEIRKDSLNHQVRQLCPVAHTFIFYIVFFFFFFTSSCFMINIYTLGEKRNTKLIDYLIYDFNTFAAVILLPDCANHNGWRYN